MKKDILIKKVDNIEECKICNHLLTELISYETAFDDTIVPCSHIENYYERTLNKDDSVIFLAKCDDKAVGYIMAYKQNNKPSCNENFITIMNLYVKESYRRMNIGKLLIEEVEKWGKKMFSTFSIELECFVDNKTAIEFYSKLNFKNVRIRMRKKVLK